MILNRCRKNYKMYNPNKRIYISNNKLAFLNKFQMNVGALFMIYIKKVFSLDIIDRYSNKQCI